MYIDTSGIITEYAYCIVIGLRSYIYLDNELWMFLSFLNVFSHFIATEQWLFDESDVPPTEDVFVKFAYESVIFLISAISQINNQEANTD